jgi:hypothetical protein
LDLNSASLEETFDDTTTPGRKKSSHRLERKSKPSRYRLCSDFQRSPLAGARRNAP